MLGNKLKKLRNYFDNMSQDDLGKILSINKSAISMIESGKRSLNHEQLLAIIQNLNIDARYLFGQIKDPSEADIRKRGDNPKDSQLEALKKEIKSMKEKWQPDSKLDSVAERVINNQALHDLVEIVQFWDANMLRRFADIAYGFISGKRYADDKKEKKVAG